VSDRYIPDRGTLDGVMEPVDGERRALLRFTSDEPEFDGTAISRVDLTGGNLEWLNSGRAPLLRDHFRTTDALVGVVEMAWIIGTEARAVVRFGQSPNATAAWLDVQSGVLCNVSMGFRASRSEVTPEGIVHREWEADEISLVWAPARRGARVLRRTITNAERIVLLAERDAAAVATAEAFAMKQDAALRAPWWRRWAEVSAPTLAAAAGCDAERLAPALAGLVEEHLAKLRAQPW
jgi:hypothetical protein